MLEVRFRHRQLLNSVCKGEVDKRNSRKQLSLSSSPRIRKVASPDLGIRASNGFSRSHGTSSKANAARNASPHSDQLVHRSHKCRLAAIAGTPRSCHTAAVRLGQNPWKKDTIQVARAAKFRPNQGKSHSNSSEQESAAEHSRRHSIPDPKCPRCKFKRLGKGWQRTSDTKLAFSHSVVDKILRIVVACNFINAFTKVSNALCSECAKLLANWDLHYPTTLFV